MRSERIPSGTWRGMAPFLLVGLLVSWLVVQNAALLLMWAWPALPALLIVARALLKVAGIVAIQLLPVVLVAGGVAMLWVTARRTPPEESPRLEEVRHG